jgi:hypothetical protein
MSFQRKLRALEYPEAVTGVISSSSYTSLSSPAFRTLVVWLEFTKIRFRPVDQRGALKAIDSPAWSATFTQYLADLECPREYAPEGMGEEQVQVVLDWLLSQAIGAEYADHAGEYNSLSRMWFLTGENAASPAGAGGDGGKRAHAGATGSASASSSSSGAASTLDCLSPSLRSDFSTEVRHLASLFLLPFDEAQLATIVRIVRKRVEESIVQAQTQAGRTAAVVNPASAAAASASSSRGGASAGKPAAAAASSSSSSGATASSKSKPARFAHTIEQPPLPQNRQEVFEILDRMDLGFQKTGGQSHARAERTGP